MTVSEFNMNGLRSFQLPEMPKKIQSCIERAPDTVVITGHKNADLDVLGSSVGLAEFLTHQFPKKKIIVVLKSISNLTKKLADSLGIVVKHELEDISFPACLILVDCNILDITGFTQEFCLENFSLRIIIDHHAESTAGNNEVHEYWLEPSFYATSEVVTTLAIQMKYKFSCTTASALLGGIIYDTQRFRRADAALFQTTRQLLQWGADYETIEALFRVELEQMEKKARLKAGQRLQLKTVKECLIAFSHVSSFEASAARAIMGLGADLAVVIASRKEETRVSVRASRSFLLAFNISVAQDLMDPIASEFGGFGGGHRGAGGLNIPKQIAVAKLVDAVMQRLEFFESKGRNGSVEE